MGLVGWIVLNSYEKSKDMIHHAVNLTQMKTHILSF